MRDTLINLGLAVATLAVVALLLVLFGVQPATLLGLFLAAAIGIGTTVIVAELMRLIDGIRGWLGWLK